MTDLMDKLSNDDLQAYKKNAMSLLERQADILDEVREVLVEGESNQSRLSDNNSDETETAINSNQGNKQQGVLTVERCEEFKQVLLGERDKVKNFDVVLAVVGTMKAGKSTTINAIVGREILPNRNRPMTSLPTLICHEKGREEPILNFNAQPVNKLVRKLKSYLTTNDYESEKQEIKELVEFIKKGNTFGKTYKGENGIFDFLQRLNDLVRLSNDINQTEDDEYGFPYEAYKNIEDLPKIDIEFANLDLDVKTQGRFMLLDTPGPNEAGQYALRKMLAEQLHRSSSVLLVLDYTQIGSDSEEAVAEEIKAIPTIEKRRLFALVNRFDQKGANSDDKQATKTNVFNGVLKNKVILENIYPLSAKRAYLGFRMLNYIERTKKIPEYKEGTWIEDFATDALGGRPERKYKKLDLKDAKEEAEILIEDSLINDLIESVILNVQKNAPIIAIQSALAGAKEINVKIHNFMDIRERISSLGELSKEKITRLEESILEVKSKINELNEKKDKFNKENLKVIKTLGFNINNEMYENSKIIIQKFNDLLIEKGNETQQAVIERQSNIPGYLKLKSSMQMLDESVELDRLRNSFIADGTKIVFSSENDLEDFKCNLDSVLQTFLDALIKANENAIIDNIDKIQPNIDELASDSQAILDTIEDDFKGENRNKKLIVTRPSFNRNLSQLKDGLYISIDHDHKVHTRKVDKPGTGPAISRVFGKIFSVLVDTGDWGKEEYEVNSYAISKNEIQDKLKLQVVSLLSKLNSEMESFFKELNEVNIQSIEKFEDIVSDIVAEMQKALDNSTIPDKKQAEEYRKRVLLLSEKYDILENDYNSMAEKFGMEKLSLDATHKQAS